MRAIWLLVLLLGLAAPAQARQDPSITGWWLTQDKGGIIDIEPCARAALCGRIIGVVLDPGEPMPHDPAGHSRCGLRIMHHLVETRRGEWAGRITDPRDNKVYDITVHQDAAGRLRMRGYVLLPLFGATQVWTRYHGAVPPDCRMTAAAVAAAIAASSTGASP